MGRGVPELEGRAPAWGSLVRGHVVVCNRVSGPAHATLRAAERGRVQGRGRGRCAQPLRRPRVPSCALSPVQDVVNTHPGLAFLKEASEFHSRYITTVSTRGSHGLQSSPRPHLLALDELSGQGGAGPGPGLGRGMLSARPQGVPSQQHSEARECQTPAFPLLRRT